MLSYVKFGLKTLQRIRRLSCFSIRYLRPLKSTFLNGNNFFSSVEERKVWRLTGFIFHLLRSQPTKLIRMTQFLKEVEQTEIFEPQESSSCHKRARARLSLLKVTAHQPWPPIVSLEFRLAYVYARLSNYFEWSNFFCPGVLF